MRRCIITVDTANGGFDWKIVKHGAYTHHEVVCSGNRNLSASDLLLEPEKPTTLLLMVMTVTTRGIYS